MILNQLLAIRRRGGKPFCISLIRRHIPALIVRHLSVLRFGKNTKPEQLIDSRQLLRFGDFAKPEQLVHFTVTSVVSPLTFCMGGEGGGLATSGDSSLPLPEGPRSLQVSVMGQFDVSRHPFAAVIPAKAGIHFVDKARHYTSSRWIPAFAGMTLDARELPAPRPGHGSIYRVMRQRINLEHSRIAPQNETMGTNEKIGTIFYRLFYLGLTLWKTRAAAKSGQNCAFFIHF
jgi:hypothetical protein